MLLSLVTPTNGRVELFGRPLISNRNEVLSRVGGQVEGADFYSYLIEGQRFVYGVKRNGQSLEVRMPLQQVSSLNVQLVNAGLEVHALIPRRSPGGVLSFYH